MKWPAIDWECVVAIGLISGLAIGFWLIRWAVCSY